MILFENTLSIPVLVALLLSAVLAGSWSTFRRLRPGAFRLVLFGLHLVTLIGLSWCLLQPGRKTSITQLQKPRFLVVMDTSKSMSLRATPDAPERWDTAIDALKQGWASKLGSECQIDLYTFSSSLGEPTSLADLPDLKPEGDSTSLRDALAKIEQRVAGLPIEGMLLLSDGTDTSEVLDDWISTARPFPVHTLRLEKPGGWQEEADVRIDSVNAARRVTAGWTSEMKVKISGQGTKGAPITVQLFENDKLIQEKPTQIPDSGGERDVVFEVERPTVGTFTYRLYVPPLKGEKNKEDNEWATIVEVVDAKNRLLYAEGVPRWEYKYLRRILLEERQISPVIFFTGGDGKPQAATPAENFTADMAASQLAEFKIVLLGNFDAAEFGAERANRLLKFVENGGSLVVLGGTKSWAKGGLLETPLGNILPISGGNPEPLEGESPFPVTLTPQAASHPAFAGDPQFWKSPPPVLSVFTGLQAKPAAESLVLAETPDGPVPLVLTQRFGQGKVAVILTDSLWRWQLGPESGDARPYKRFWSQLLSWLLPKEEDLTAEKLELFADRNDIFLGEKIALNARIAKLDGQRPGAIDATIVFPDGREIPYRMESRRVETATGEAFEGFALDFKADIPGSYRVSATAKTPQETIISKPMSFYVKAFSPETSPRPTREDVLQAISNASGGTFFEDVRTLNAAFSAFDMKAKEENFSEFETLWRNWPTLVGLMLLFTITWFARRKRLMP
jgi:hypothetical protein